MLIEQIFFVVWVVLVVLGSLFGTGDSFMENFVLSLLGSTLLTGFGYVVTKGFIFLFLV